MKIIDEKWDGTGEICLSQQNQKRKKKARIDHEQKTLYRIRWKGYDPSYDTWEPRNNLGGHEAMLHVWEYQNRCVCRCSPPDILMVTLPNLCQENQWEEEVSPWCCTCSRLPYQWEDQENEGRGLR